MAELAEQLTVDPEFHGSDPAAVGTAAKMQKMEPIKTVMESMSHNFITALIYEFSK